MSDDQPRDDGTGDRDESRHRARPRPEERDPNGQLFEAFPVDPIGVTIAVLIIVVAGGLLVVGPLSGSQNTTTGPPSVDWTHHRVNATHVQIAHVDGETVAAERVVLTVNGTPRAPGWPARISPGTVVLVAAPPGATVELYWNGTDRVRLANFSV